LPLLELGPADHVFVRSFGQPPDLVGRGAFASRRSSSLHVRAEPGALRCTSVLACSCMWRPRAIKYTKTSR
jgi:hypothetical protein